MAAFFPRSVSARTRAGSTVDASSVVMAPLSPLRLQVPFRLASGNNPGRVVRAHVA